MKGGLVCILATFVLLQMHVEITMVSGDDDFFIGKNFFGKMSSMLQNLVKDILVKSRVNELEPGSQLQTN